MFRPHSEKIFFFLFKLVSFIVRQVMIELYERVKGSDLGIKYCNCLQKHFFLNEKKNTE